MPYLLPDGFPSDLTNADLDAVVGDLVDSLRARFGDEVGAWLPELQLALLTVAIGDQSRRQLIAGSRVALLSLLVAGTALIVAVIGVFVE